jgi:hypothetical protein
LAGRESKVAELGHLRGGGGEWRRLGASPADSFNGEEGGVKVELRASSEEVEAGQSGGANGGHGGGCGYAVTENEREKHT